MKKTLLILFLAFVAFRSFAQEAYTLSSDSKLTIDGTSTVHDWTVTANSIQGTLNAEANAPNEIDFQVDVADIKSERGATMDKKMHNALEKDLHPKVMFTLKEVKEESTLAGTLTIAGKEQNVEITTKIMPSGDELRITGEHGIALKDFNIEPPTAMFGQVIVGDDVTVKFDLVFKKD